MPRRVFTYPRGPGLRRAEPGLERRRLRPRRRLRGRSSGTSLRPKRKAALRAAQSVERRHARVAARRCRAGRGASARSRRSTAAIRCGTSRTSCATSTKAASTCPTPRRAARDAGHVASSTPSRCSACACPGRPSSRSWPRVATGGVFIFSHLPLVVAGGARAASLALGVDPGLAVDRHGAASRRSTTKDVGLGLTLPLYVSGPASVGWWAMFITMLGDMTAFMSPGLRLLLLLDDPRRLPARPVAGPGRALARIAGALLLGAWAADAARAALEPARSRGRLLRSRSRPPVLLAARRRGGAARRALASPGSIPTQPRLPGDRLDAGGLDGGPRRGRRHHAALLRRAPARRPA